MDKINEINKELIRTDLPDFRSAERAFQLMMQVSGRAGRKDKQGKVIIQTFDTNHIILKFLLKHNYNSFYLWYFIHYSKKRRIKY